MFTWIKRLFARPPQAPPSRCPRCQAEMDAGEIICPQCGHGFNSRQDPIVELQTLLNGGPPQTFTGVGRAKGAAVDCRSSQILFLHSSFRKGFVVSFEGVSGLFHAFTLFQHVCLKTAELPFATAGSPTAVEEARTRQNMLEGWPGPEPYPSAEVASIPASHLVGCVHGNTWDYCPWFALKSEGLFQDLFIGGDHAPDEIPQFEGHRIILLGRARGLRTWVIDLPEDQVAHVRVVRILSTEEVDDWCVRLIKAGAGLKLEGRAGCAICTHRLATLE